MTDLTCKKCGSDHYIKAGVVRAEQVQRYKCKACGSHFTDTKGHGRPMSQKLLALSLYASGLSLNRIARYFDVSTPAVLRWVRVLGETLCLKPKPKGQVIVMELDEMWHYVGSKKTSYGSGKLMILMETSSLTGSVGIVMKQP